MTDVTYLGYVYGTLAALRRCSRATGARSSRSARRWRIAGSRCRRRTAPPSTAIRGFTESLRCELLHDGSDVRVTMVQLPAINTPQFLGESRPAAQAAAGAADLPAGGRRRAIHFAALHRRRELWVGAPTVRAILAQRLVPGWLDRYLATRAWEGQQSDDPARPGTPDNLEDPVAADVGAHGAFDDMASEVSPLLWADMHREVVAGAALGLTVLLVGAARSLRRT